MGMRRRGPEDDEEARARGVLLDIREEVESRERARLRGYRRPRAAATDDLELGRTWMD